MPATFSNRFRYRLVLYTLLVTAFVAGTVPASAQTEVFSEQSTSENVPYVTLDTGSLSIPADGSFDLSVSVAIDRPTSYLESRVQIYNPGGRLLYQKTEIRHDVATGTVTIGYQRDLADLNLTPGIYPVKLRVRSDSAGEVREWTLADRLLIYDPTASQVPLALVVRVSATPSYDSEGRFVVDPGQFDSARQQVDEVAQWVIESPSLHLNLALPPMLAEEWSRITDGYETSGPDGVGEVSAQSEVPRRYAATLARLQTALATGRLELMTVGYADPDLVGMQSGNRLGDLSDQFARGYSAMFASVASSPTPGAVLAHDIVPAAALGQIASRGLEYFLVAPESLAASETTPPSGVYRCAATTDSGEPVHALVTDSQVSSALQSDNTTVAIDAIFQRAISDEVDSPLVAVLTVGPGRNGSVAGVREYLSRLSGIPWAEFVTAGSASHTSPSGDVELSVSPSTESTPPRGYWEETAHARRLATGLIEAVGTNDTVAQAVSDASLVAQSQAWAGPDGTWASAERGLGFASAASRTAQGVFDAISLSGQDITLSSTRGSVPVNVTNDSERTLSLRLVTSANGVALPGSPSTAITVRPQDNFFTVPVDLQSSLSGAIKVEVYAGSVLIDSTSIGVRASFLDRLAIVGLIVITLVVLLLYIRRRARGTDSAGNMRSSGHQE